MYEMSQRHLVWVAKNHVNPCNSVQCVRGVVCGHTRGEGGLRQIKHLPQRPSTGQLF